MRKVTYEINDAKYFMDCFHDKLTKEDFDVFFSKPFIATYILYGENGQFPSYYKLLDAKGEKMSVNGLNGYERGVVLNDCERHFNGVPCENGSDRPCGVVQIIETEVEEAMT